MSSLRQQENVTELHLTYQDLVAGQLVIVIDGLPTTDYSSSISRGNLRLVSAAEPTDRGGNGSFSLLSEEAAPINEAVGYASVFCTPLVLAAWKGQEAAVAELISSLIEDAPAGHERGAAALADYARAILFNGLGRYQDAFVAAESACAHDGLRSLAWPELVEAAARINARGAAAKAMGAPEEQASVAVTDSALGLEARSVALLSDGDHAEALYCNAIELLSRARATVQLARAQLVYGEWLRRESRRLDAREQLRAAHDAFSSFGAVAFAERALRELRATGATARRRKDETRAQLTPQEGQIARLARDGFSNPEIGTQLFLSPRTVQYHLRKVFQKLEITSRNQLGRIQPSRLGGGPNYGGAASD